MFQLESRIRFSEIDHTGRLSIPGLVNYFQDTTTFHGEEIGQSVQYAMETGHVWLMSSWQIEVKRLPKMGERVKICTWPTGMDKCFGFRNFQMKSVEGEELARAYSIWTYCDVKKGRPLKLTKEILDLYPLEPALDMEIQGRKITLPEEMTDQEALPVRRGQIDTNEHVNNCQYIQMALEVCPECACAERIRVEYKKAAVYGDVIIPAVGKAGRTTTVNLKSAAGQCFAIVEFTV